VYRDAEYSGVMTDQEVLSYLTDLGMWSLGDQQFIDDLPKQIEDMKADMYNAHEAFRSRIVEQLRKNIDAKVRDAHEILTRRHSYDAYTCEGLAINARMIYVLARSTVDAHDRPVDPTDDLATFQEIVAQYTSSAIPDTQIRLLARTDPWRGIWTAGKAEGRIFGVPSTMLTDDQKMLITWSTMYDSIRENMECPDDIVINDDYLLDGWLIVQGRKKAASKKESGRKDVKGDEIYVVAETPEDAKRINSMNDTQSQLVKQQRKRVLAEQGEVRTEKLPDSQLQLRQMAVQAMRNRTKG
jgi:hypothetical protein